MKMFLISGMREEMMEFVWEVLTDSDSFTIMHRADFYDSCGLFVKVKEGIPVKRFVESCNAYGIDIRLREPDKEAA